MVWAGSCDDGRTKLRVIDGASDCNIVEPILKQPAGAISDDFVLMHDNARTHVPRVVKEYMEEA